MRPTFQIAYLDNNSNEFCDYQFQRHEDVTLLGRLRYQYPHYQTVSTPHWLSPISPAGIQRNHKLAGKMAWGWGGRWDCFYLHLFYNKIQSLCCDRIRHQEVSRFGCFCCYCLHRPIWYILMWDWLDRNPLSCKCSIYLNIQCKKISFSVLVDNFSALPYVLGVPKSIHHFRKPNALCLPLFPKFQFFLGITVV